MRQSHPHHRKLGGRPADRDDLARDSSMRGDNTAAWEARCAPVLAMLSAGGKTLAEVRLWGRAYRPDGRHGSAPFGANLAEDCLYWLEARGRVVRGDDRKWRIADGV